MAIEAVEKMEKGSGWRTVYESLRRDILSLELRPGQLLDETSLADRFNLSRSPVREALIRLSGDDLVTILPNRSTIVSPLEISSIPKYVEALDLAQRINHNKIQIIQPALNAVQNGGLDHPAAFQRRWLRVPPIAAVK